jgi:hypothetical protein
MSRLELLCRKWRIEALLYCGLLALAVSLVLWAVLHLVWAWPWWTGFFVLGVSFVLALVLYPFWRLTLADIAVFLNSRLPELEDSCGLMLRPAGELSGLERLQAARVGERFGRLEVPQPFRRRLWVAAGWLGLAVVVSMGLGWIGKLRMADMGGGRVVEAGRALKAAGRLRSGGRPGLKAVKVRVVAPAYTGKAVREQHDLNIQAEAGAVVDWELETSAAVDTVSFLVNDNERWYLRPADAGRTVWRLSKPALRPGFYQVKVGTAVSAMYKFELIPDEAPRIVISRPKPYTLVDYGEPEAIPLEVALRDDYGIVDASVMATVSSGKGEAVKFKEQELRWGRSFGGRAYHLTRVLDLPALGLKPGDELYFYCKARDNHGQETKTETYIVALADTAQLMSLQGMTLATDVKPEFFRSERQIIIETEQLLSRKDTIAVSAFNGKSNDLGIDQKLLRLRYGKFLGEEAEEGGGAGLDTVSFGNFGDATKILDVYTDKHDNAEDASYFEPGVKAQLKATLNEMWNAELRLRTFKPKEALPYCYKALRLLKDLQQQSRAFVSKTGVRTTPLNPDKRLTGELGAIVPPRQQVAKAVGVSEEDILRSGLAVLEGMRQGMALSAGDQGLLLQVERRLGGAAAASPGKFLAGYVALKKIMEVRAGDFVTAERGIVALLPVAQASPRVRRGWADGGLEALYFGFISK